MYCIYVSTGGNNIQKVVTNNQVVTSENIQALMPVAKNIKVKKPEMNVTIVDIDTGSIVVDYQ